MKPVWLWIQSLLVWLRPVRAWALLPVLVLVLVLLVYLRRTHAWVLLAQAQAPVPVLLELQV
jgi:hypothetical protein